MREKLLLYNNLDFLDNMKINLHENSQIVIAYNWHKYLKKKKAKERALRLKLEKEKSTKSYRKSMLAASNVSAHSGTPSRQDPSVTLSSNTSKDKVKKSLNKQATVGRPERRNFASTTHSSIVHHILPKTNKSKRQEKEEPAPIIINENLDRKSSKCSCESPSQKEDTLDDGLKVAKVLS